MVTSHSKSDHFGRKIFDELQLGTGIVSRQFAYHAGQITEEHSANRKMKSSPATQLISQIILSDGRTLSYEYDAEDRITKVTDSSDGVTEYTYDALGQLLAEKYCAKGSDEFAPVNVMTYDNYGNILSKNGVSYSYDSTWKDLLTGIGEQTITYDVQGNPTSYLGHILTWEKGRQLKSFDSNTYTYNTKGIRTGKTVNGVKHTYTLEGTKILREAWGNNTLIPLYDNVDNVCGIIYNDEPFYFLKNLQGDVIAVTDKDGAAVAKYSYDAWGVCTILSDISDCGIAQINPYRYRSYYYDSEIGMYYLQSRYYNPAVGRFINADEFCLSLFILNNNLFSYCNNNCVMNEDCSGYYTYNRNNAVNYARTWGYGYNEDYYYYSNGDCTNFVSQCMYAGGIPMNDIWHSYKGSRVPYWFIYSEMQSKYRYNWDVSEAWRLINNHFNYFSNYSNGYIKGIVKIRTKSDMRRLIRCGVGILEGDIMYLAIYYTAQYWSLQHATIITKIKNYELCYSAHTRPRVDHSVLDYLDEDSDHCLVVMKLK